MFADLGAEKYLDMFADLGDKKYLDTFADPGDKKYLDTCKFVGIDDLSDGSDNDGMLSPSAAEAMEGMEVLGDIDCVLGIQTVEDTQGRSRRGEALQAWNSSKQKHVGDLATSLGLHGALRREFRKSARPAHRLVKRQHMKVDSLQRAMGATSSSWNRAKLRLGEHLDPARDQRVSGRGTRRRQHPRAWSLQGTLRFAFRQLGALHPHASTMTESHRSLDAISAVALAAKDHSTQATKVWSDGVLNRADAPAWVAVSRVHDCTPVRISFGGLSHLATVARYWHRENQRMPAQLLTAAQMHEKGITVLPRYGIVELLAQKGTIAWPELVGEHFISVSARPLQFAPCFLQRGTGSCILAGLQRADPGLSIEDLLALTSSVKHVVFFLGSDMAASCGRAKLEVAHRLRAHNRFAGLLGYGRVLFVDGQCVAHALHREVEAAFNTKQLIPKMYAVAWCSSLPGVFASIMSALRAVITADMRYGFYAGVEPSHDDSTRQHVATLIDISFLRQKFVRAAWEDGESVSDEWQDLVNEYKKMVNGDPRKSFVEHYCWEDNCCCGRQVSVCIDKLTDLFGRCFFLRLGVNLPASNKWWTCGEHLAKQAAGAFSHRILPRVVQLAFVPDGVAAGDEDNYHATVNQRKGAALDFLSDHGQAIQSLGTALIASAPVDHLSYRLQSLDSVGGSGRELVDRGPASPLLKCQRSLWEVVNPWCPSRFAPHFAALWWQLEFLQVDMEQAVSEARAACVGLCAGVWVLQLRCSRAACRCCSCVGRGLRHIALLVALPPSSPRGTGESPLSS